MENCITIKSKSTIKHFLWIGISIMTLFVMVARDGLGQVVAENLQNVEHVDLDQISITVDFNNTPLDQAIIQVGQKAGVTFNYNSKLLSMEDEVTYRAENMSVSELLKAILPQTISYMTVRNIVIMQRRESKKSTDDYNNYQEMITGRVIDAQTKEPLPGVNIVIKETDSGTSTDADGIFELAVPSMDVTLVFSYIGYMAKEVEIDDNQEINIQLEQDVSFLNEVIVVGFDTRDRANVTGAVSSVKMEDVLGDRPMTDASKVLQGAMPGLEVTYNSGQPGIGTSLNIRGFESINGGEPLVLVDNVPMSIEDVNPRDIEEVTVLKDAAAASIYGARAAFGVILITTKRGETNQPIQFEYSTTLGATFPTTMPEKASALEYIQALQDWGQSTYYLGHDLDKWANYIRDYQSNPSNYPGGYIDDPDEDRRYHLEPNDVYQEMHQTGYEHIHNFSFSGGSQNSSYRVSLGYTDENGFLVTDKDSFNRYNANVRLTTDLTSRLTTSVNAIYSHGFRKDPYMGNYFTLYYRAVNYHPTNPVGYWENDIGELIPYATPANMIRYTPARETTNENIRLSGQATYQIIDNIELNAEYTFEKRETVVEAPSVIPAFNFGYAMAYVPYNPNSSSYSINNGNSNYNALNVYTNYREDFGSHNLNVLLGMNQEENTSEGFSASRSVLLSPDIQGLSTATGSISLSDSYTDFGVVGFFGRINYSFMEKYLLEINSRYDGSSRFPKGNRFGFFPSVSAGWILTNEPFMQGFGDKLSHLKFRASWGEIGNQDIDNYAFIPTMNTTNLAWINNNTGERAISFSMPDVVSDNFTWETVQTLNLGVDIGLFDDRFYTAFDWYNRKTLDMLAPGSELPAVLGTSAPLENVADLKTKGWELDIRWRDQIGDFGYSIGFNLYDHKTNILDFDNEAGLLSQYYVGQQIGEIWGYSSDGYYTVDDFEPGTLDADQMGGTLRNGIPAFIGVNPNPGDIKYVDLNGDGEISSGANTLDDPGDRTIIGNSTRRYQFGIRGSVSYKGFDLNFLIQGVGKRDLWVGNDLFFPYRLQFSTIYSHQLNYWTSENPEAYYPRNYPFAGGNYGTSRQVQTKYLQNGAFARLQNFTIGYTFPQRLFDNFGLNNMRVFFSGENLIDFNHLPNSLHPELTDLGQGGNYSFPRKLTAGFNISF